MATTVPEWWWLEKTAKQAYVLTLVGSRQKNKGMSWSRLGSKALSLLKVVELNGQLEQLWFPAQAAWPTDHLQVDFLYESALSLILKVNSLVQFV